MEQLCLISPHFFCHHIFHSRNKNDNNNNNYHNHVLKPCVKYYDYSLSINNHLSVMLMIVV